MRHFGLHMKSTAISVMEKQILFYVVIVKIKPVKMLLRALK